MDIKEFSGNMKNAVSKILGEGYTVEETVVSKNNGVALEALVIRKEGINLSPTIYLKSYYENNLDGESIRDGAMRLAESYFEAVPEHDIDVDFYGNYDKVRRGLSYKLISTKRNEELLETVPHVPFLDLDIVFYYSLNTAGMPDGTILIRNTHMEMWGVTTEDLMRDAMERAPLTAPELCQDMQTVLKRLYDSSWNCLPDAEDMPEIYVVTNTSMVFGASAMLYPGLLKRLSDRMNGNLYIIPSSIHEVLVISDDGSGNSDYLREMIWSVNRTQLKPQDILSDSLYYFDRQTERITIAS